MGGCLRMKFSHGCANNKQQCDWVSHSMMSDLLTRHSLVTFHVTEFLSGLLTVWVTQWGTHALTQAYFAHVLKCGWVSNCAVCDLSESNSLAGWPVDCGVHNLFYDSMIVSLFGKNNQQNLSNHLLLIKLFPLNGTDSNMLPEWVQICFNLAVRFYSIVLPVSRPMAP